MDLQKTMEKNNKNIFCFHHFS